MIHRYVKYWLILDTLNIVLVQNTACLYIYTIDYDFLRLNVFSSTLILV